MNETEHDDMHAEFAPETHMESASEMVATSTPPADPEPVAPAHIRLESGTMSELMTHVKAWLAWAERQV